MTAQLSGRLDEARVALMFLTRLPVGHLKEPVPSLADARWALPLVGLVVGAATWLVFHGALAVGLASLPSSFLALGAAAAMTGGLHHDGLADFADGIGGGRDKEHCLEIMRDSRIGAYGVIALIFAVALAASALSSLASDAELWQFLLIGTGSRLAMVIALNMLPPARPEGLGLSASATGLGSLVPGIAAVVVLAVLGGAKLWIVLLALSATAAIVAWLAYRRIGGQTGDVLGAIQLSSEVVAWLTLAAIVTS